MHGATRPLSTRADTFLKAGSWLFAVGPCPSEFLVLVSSPRDINLGFGPAVPLKGSAPLLDSSHWGTLGAVPAPTSRGSGGVQGQAEECGNGAKGTMTQHFSTSPYYSVLPPPASRSAERQICAEGGFQTELFPSPRREMGASQAKSLQGAFVLGVCAQGSRTLAASTLLGHSDSEYHSDSAREAGWGPSIRKVQSPLVTSEQ